MNQATLSAARSQRSRSTCAARTRRNWTPRLALSAFALAASALACGSPTPIERAPDANPGVVVDASAPEDSPTWCSVQAIFSAKCQRCHGSPTQHGAPFALVSYDDTQASNKKGKVRFERIAQAVEEGTMPALWINLEPLVEPLLDEERSMILAWCAHGALLTGSASCAPVP
ncbi:MAG TPA: hypothetical protein VJV79_37220 [Polyangiaceae bacterium]|nr:hypothetical protein [Polyangiaceae bacterium]